MRAQSASAVSSIPKRRDPIDAQHRRRSSPPRRRAAPVPELEQPRGGASAKSSRKSRRSSADVIVPSKGADLGHHARRDP